MKVLTRRKARLTWAAASKKGTLKVDGARFTFRAGAATMETPQGRVPLPAAPFLSLPGCRMWRLGMVEEGEPAGALYVPLKPLAQRLGLTYRLSPHLVTITDHSSRAHP